VLRPPTHAAAPGGQRAASIAWVACGLALLHGLAPDAAVRRELLGLVALPVGYGHLLAAVCFARSRAPLDPLATALRVSTLAILLAGYLALLGRPAGRLVVAALLVLSGWHIAENDRALTRAYGRGLRLPPLERGVRAHLAAFGVTGLLAALALTSPSGASALHSWGLPSLPVRGPALDDLAGVVLMVHAVRWLLFSRDRARCLPARAARRLRFGLLALHVLPAAVCVLVWLRLPALHAWLASPALYLFGSAVHAVQTAWRRGVEPAP
jgi:hypothetical protein